MIKKYVGIVVFSLYVIYAYIVDNLFLLYQNFPKLGVVMDACVVTPLWEEAVYRYAPIEICRVLNEKLIVPVVICVSFLFGFGHQGTIENIYYQGVFGLALSYVYLKSKHPFTSVFLMHGVWNFLAIILKY